MRMRVERVCCNCDTFRPVVSLLQEPKSQVVLMLLLAQAQPVLTLLLAQAVLTLLLAWRIASRTHRPTFVL